MSDFNEEAYDKRRAAERWREDYERRLEAAEDRMDKHEVQCGERYTALSHTLMVAATDRKELREDVRSLAIVGQRNFFIVLIAIILIAFASVFKEATIIEFVRAGVSAWNSSGGGGGVAVVPISPAPTPR